MTERYQGVDIRCQDGVDIDNERQKTRRMLFVFAAQSYLLNLGEATKDLSDNEMGEKEYISRC